MLGNEFAPMETHEAMREGEDEFAFFLAPVAVEDERNFSLNRARLFREHKKVAEGACLQNSRILKIGKMHHNALIIARNERKMNERIGVRAHDLIASGTPEELAKTIQDAGFSYIQLVFKKALKEPEFTEAYARRVEKALSSRCVSVAMLGAYFNPVHSDPSVVSSGIDIFKKNLAIASVFPGNPPVGSETGSFNDSPWIYHPKNRTEEGYQQTKAVFAELAAHAESLGADIAIESAYGHVICDVDRHVRLLEELHSERVYATVDLFNLLCPENFAKRDAIFEDALRRLHGKVRIIHIKDGLVRDGKLIQTNPGEGEFHYEAMMASIKAHAPDAILVFEGVKAPAIETSKRLILNTLSKS